MVLRLTLKKKWFDMILSGEKKEEYRDLKPYWFIRLSGREFSHVHFTNGYGKDKPQILIECEGVNISQFGVHKWGFQEKCYVIKLGEIIETKNIK